MRLFQKSWVELGCLGDFYIALDKIVPVMKLQPWRRDPGSKPASIPVEGLSAPDHEPKTQMHYCDHTLSVVRPSVVNFHIFDFSSETAEQNSTKLDRKQDLNVLYKGCVFRIDRKKQDCRPSSDWLRHFLLLLWNRWREFDETWQESRSQGPLPSLRFSGRSEK